MNRVEYEDGTVHANGNARMKGSALYPAAMGEAIFTAWQRAFRSGSLSSPAVQHVMHAHDDPWGEAETISAAVPTRPVAKSPKRTAKSKESSSQAKESCRQSQASGSQSKCGDSKACHP